MDIVILESPYAGDSKEAVNQNTAYARLCMQDSLKRGEAPMVSHLLYTQVLNDDIPEQRQQGIDAGLSWRAVASKSVMYQDRGISMGMRYGIDAARKAGIPIEYRQILT